MRGLRREPLAPWNSAKAFWTYRGLALQPAQNVGGLNVLGTLDVFTSPVDADLETALREKPGEWMVAVELPSPWRSGQASWPARHDSLCGFHERSKHVRVDMFSRHTSGVVREME